MNCPRGAVALRNYQRDGLMRLDGNGGGAPNYEPNSRGGPRETPAVREVPIPLHGETGRTPYPVRADDFEQAGLLYRVMSAEERTRLLENLAGHMRGVDPAILARQLGHFVRADEEHGTRLAELVGVPRKDIA